MPENRQPAKKVVRSKPLRDYQLAHSKKSKKRFGKRKVVVVLILLVIVLAAVIVGLFIESGILTDFLGNSFGKPQLFIIEDRCSLIVGQLIHSIKDESVCEIKCKSECEVREMKFYNSEFIENENDCNQCKCYCK